MSVEAFFKWFQAKAGLKAHEPQKLVVFGAGYAEVNGEYTFASRNSTTNIEGTDTPVDAPIYARKGRWDGNDVLFVISCLEAEPGGRQRWFISVDCLGRCRRGAACLQRQIYVSSLVFGGIPPLRGWWDNHGGRSLPPIVFVGDSKVLDWRHDQAESFADFKITIVHKDTDITSEYHVHRIILANASTYFARMFGTPNKDGYTFVEGMDLTSRIELEPLREIIPCMLDYIYWHYSNSGSPSTMNPCVVVDAVDLTWLADYFDIPSLRGHLKKSWDDWLELKFLETTAEDMKKCANWGDIQIIIKLCQDTATSEEHGRKASQFLAAFCLMHPVDAEAFASLTDASLLPHIDPSAAWDLLEIESKLLTPSPSTLTDLQERCIQALARNFVKLDTGVDSPLRLQSNNFVVKLIEVSQQQVLVKETHKTGDATTASLGT